MTRTQSFKALAQIDQITGDWIWGQVKTRLFYPEQATTPQLLSKDVTMKQLMDISYCKDLLEKWQLVDVTISLVAKPSL